MGRRSTATKIAKNIEIVKQDLASAEIDLNAPAVDPDIVNAETRKPQVLPDLTVDEKTGQPKVEASDAIKMSFEDLEKAGCKNKSDSIRFLASLGHKKSPIAKFLGVRYQHVNNVLNKELKRKVLPWVAGTAEPQVETVAEGETEE